MEAYIERDNINYSELSEKEKLYLLESIKECMKLYGEASIRLSFPIDKKSIPLIENIVNLFKQLRSDSNIISKNITDIESYLANKKEDDDYELSGEELEYIDKQGIILAQVYSLIKSFLVPMCNDSEKVEGINISDIDENQKELLEECDIKVESDNVTPKMIDSSFKNLHKQVLKLRDEQFSKYIV